MLLVFWNFTVLFLCVGFIFIILLETFCDSWICWFLPFIRYRKISVIFSLLLDICWIFLFHPIFPLYHTSTFLSLYPSLLLEWYGHAGWWEPIVCIFSSSIFSNVMLVTWNWPWWEYLHHGNKQIRALLSPQRAGLSAHHYLDLSSGSLILSQL